MQTFNFIVDQENSNLRLDVYLTKVLPAKTSRTLIQHLICEGKVEVNKISVKSHKKVKEGDKVFVELKEHQPQKVRPEKIRMEILYEDRDVLVINKPEGMVVHPAVGNYSGTLVNALLYHCQKLSDLNHPLRPGIVHRLDKDTSGVMVVAKNNAAHMALAEQFQEHSIQRKYVALVSGRVEFDEGMVDMPLGRSTRDREKISVTFNQGKEAQTFYKVLRRFTDKTLLEIYPRTGRTHQIRVHLAYLGHPILGDKKYGDAASFSRLALHAQSLGFIHPTKVKFMEFKSELPREFKNFLPTPVPQKGMLRDPAQKIKDKKLHKGIDILKK